jgi:hypothetical protein
MRLLHKGRASDFQSEGEGSTPSRRSIYRLILVRTRQPPSLEQGLIAHAPQRVSNVG